LPGDGAVPQYLAQPPRPVILMVYTGLVAAMKRFPVSLLGPLVVWRITRFSSLRSLRWSLHCWRRRDVRNESFVVGRWSCR